MGDPIQGHKDAVFRLAVLPDGVLVSASWDSSIKLWDPYTRSCIATLHGHQVHGCASILPRHCVIVFPAGKGASVSHTARRSHRLWWRR